MRYDLWREVRYLGGAQTKLEALSWARNLVLRDGVPITIKHPRGRIIKLVTLRGAKSAVTRAVRS
jgi:hypothetical protein